MDKNTRCYYPNMDLMRYVMAIAVVIAHINELASFNIPFFISSYEAVGGFFALSGFLMYPNYKRHDNLCKYTTQRAKRILPPYFFIVVVAAFSLSSVSLLSLHDYFTNRGFWQYLAANISFLNWLHPKLPGVFSGEAYYNSAVNGALWTMKVEWCLYFSVPAFVWITSKFHRLRCEWLAWAIILFSVSYRLLLTKLYHTTGIEIYNILSRQFFGQLAFFYSGMLIYFVRDVFRRNLGLMFLSGIILYLISTLSIESSILLNPIALSMLVMVISLFPKDPVMLRHNNNVSYEIYLFHCPIIKLSVYLGISQYSGWVEITFVGICTIALSLIAHHSWELITSTYQQHRSRNKVKLHDNH